MAHKKSVVLYDGVMKLVQSGDVVEGQLSPVSKDHNNDNDTLSSDTCVFLDSSTSAFTLNLPSSPTQNDQVKFIDIVGSCGTNNITINRNGEPIMGALDNMLIDVDNASFHLIYSDSTNGWRIV